MISDARGLAAEFKYLCIRLELEQQRLLNWSSEVGLLEYLESGEVAPNSCLLGLNRATVLKVLLEIEHLATSFIENKERYKPLLPDESSNDPMSIHENTGDRNIKASFSEVLRFIKKIQISVSSVQDVPKKLRWATFSKDGFESLINRLRELNDVLVDLADSNTQAAILRSTRETNTTVLQLRSKVEELDQLIKALLPDIVYEMAQLRLSLNTSSQHEASPMTKQRHELASLALLKSKSVLIESKEYFSGEGVQLNGCQVSDLKLRRSDIYLIQDAADDRCAAVYRPLGQASHQVWIEWREYDVFVHGHIDANIPSRIDKLVALLKSPYKPDVLRVPDCLGYFDDAEVTSEIQDQRPKARRLGFVFQNPVNSSTNIVALQKLLKSQPPPLLTKRVDLARAVSSCVHHLHSINWLHKGLRSDNVVFSAEQNVVDFSKPFLSGFGYARPAYRDEFTEILSENPLHDMYRHPFTHGRGPYEERQGFRRTFDFYSLGIVLMEIAVWDTIDRIVGIEDPRTANAAVLSGIRSRLLDEKHFLDDVGSNVGYRYQEVTRICLQGSSEFGIGLCDDESDVVTAVRLSKMFYNRVLKPLDEIQT